MFSIILCTYNRADILGRAIESALEQTWRDFELKVIDDGSTDGTAELVAEFRTRDPRVHYIFHGRNLGVAAARNTGLRAAGREWVTFLDSDDTYLPGHLALRAKLIDGHPELDLIHSPARVIGQDWVADRDDPSRRIPIEECRIGGTFFLKRSRALEIGGFPQVPYGDDALFFQRAEERGLCIFALPVRTYVYDRRRTDSVTWRMALRPGGARAADTGTGNGADAR